MKNYDVILFDLDGTLTDPGEGITNSVAHALRRSGIEPPPRQELYKFIGPPLYESFKHFFGMSEEEALRAVDYYREYYRDRGIFENFVYDGIPQLLSRLKTAGKKPIVATSKPDVFAERIMEHFGLAEYFTYIAGATLDGSRILKADVIAHAFDGCGVTDLSRVIMVGDREHDVLGARAMGIDCIGVLYGYGDLEELENAGAAYVAASPEEIGRIILGV